MVAERAVGATLTNVNPIVAEVTARGRVSFADFMELALYDPRNGYYTRTRRGSGPVGRAGDYLTAPTASPIFAAVMARLLDDLVGETGRPVTLLELGAGEGLFLESLRQALGRKAKKVVERVVAIEVGEWARKRLARRWRGAEVASCLAEVPRPRGSVMLFASELYDALPANRVTVRREGHELVLREFFVEPAGRGKLRWTAAEPTSPAIAAYLQDCGVVLEEGQIAEVRPRLRALHAANLAWCGHDGLAVLVEYGHPTRRLYDSKMRRHGSLVGYRRHRVVDDVLSQPGSIDITAHVSFDDLSGGAADIGWERGEIRPLGAFLALHGGPELLPSARNGALSSAQWAELASAKRLLVPSGMGIDLKVLVQGRGEIWEAYRRAATPPPLEA